MPVIRVSPEVFTALQRHAIPLSDTPDSVLRRLLNIDKVTTGTTPGAVEGPEGKLLPLLKAGLLQPGTRLVWHQSRLGNTFYATVLSRGALLLDDGQIAKSPSGACHALTGKSYDGWEEFRRESDNALLSELRTQLPANATRP
jgi:Restriction Enzyme Adenine Methylase Associated